MAVTMAINGDWITLTSSVMADVRGALSSQGIPEHKLKGFAYDPDGSVYVAVCHK